MIELIKAASIPVILVLLIASSWYFLVDGTEGALVTSWVSGTLAAVFGYLGGQAVKVSYRGWRKLTGKIDVG